MGLIYEKKLVADNLMLLSLSVGSLEMLILREKYRFTLFYDGIKMGVPKHRPTHVYFTLFIHFPWWYCKLRSSGQDQEGA
jgi:hypothetical protein